jgi:hypothetical protein
VYIPPKIPDVDVRVSASPDDLYVRAANALERSALLAEDHAERLRQSGLGELAELELERARRARELAEHGRALASRFR